ncbi:MAG: Lysophospholipase L1 [Erysipelotrichaceae bacterium]|nr:MAG: Lysophospholipase [Erysipelotrichaceae bacterium]TXT17932.1 MAG: Lysophospholipase L1 [Erysipelotrichaceae bacterium]
MNSIWEADIKKIEETYKGLSSVDLVFIGSSSIVYWTTLKEDFKAYSVVNAGFGGSKIQDAIDAYERLVKPYDPSLIVLFSGTNDLHGEQDSATPAYVCDKVEEFMRLSLKHCPKAKLFYISLTPAPCRFNVITDVLKANRLIKHLSKTIGFTFIDLQDEFLDSGMPRLDLFLEDALHMNSKGYEKWVSVIKPMVDHAMMDRCL